MTTLMRYFAFLFLVLPAPSQTQVSFSNLFVKIAFYAPGRVGDITLLSRIIACGCINKAFLACSNNKLVTHNLHISSDVNN